MGLSQKADNNKICHSERSEESSLDRVSGLFAALRVTNNLQFEIALSGKFSLELLK